MGGKIMAKLSNHAEWLSLVEISGPFLAISVLDQVFPQGLDAIFPNSRKRIRSAYNEWCDAQSDEDPEIIQLHQAWIQMVLTEFLEFQDDILTSGTEYTINAEDGNGSFTPDWVIKDNDDKPMMFVAQLAPGRSPHSISRDDNWTASALDKMTKLCRINNVRLGLLTNGEEWMLINAPNGQTSGQVTWYARLWFQEPKTLQAFSSLLGVRRFFGPEDEKLPALLDESLDCFEEVTNTLGSQVRTAVEVLIQGLDKADEDRNRELLRDVSPAELYEAGLTVMMRLVFILCAEERGLLLLGNEAYDTHYAISTLRAQLAEEADKHGTEILERRHDAWARLLSVFRAVYAGIEHEELRLPALGGSIFDPDKYPFLEGRPKNSSWRTCNPTPLPIDNRTVLLLLNSLQILEQSGGAILLSYRALDVEQIGHIYEGLLEYTAIRASEITLGLRGSAKAKNPLIPLPTLESLALESEKKLFEYVKKITNRSQASIKNDYNRDVDITLQEKLVAVCGGNKELINRIIPFANWLRMDAWEQPLVYRKNAFMISLGQDRRDSGTHYTPKTLTEKIVKTTLEPVVYQGVAEGLPREEWILKTPEELLNLKICDPAMGSGAFLVQVCRYLANKLFEAWEIAENNGKFINVDGVVCDNEDYQEPLSSILDERMNTAKRLVAEKCLYGVDINPLAVELAKLAIWLITISKGRPFGFLDHNLKSGDSLLGIHDIEQLRQLKMKPTHNGFSHLFGMGIGSAVNKALELREDIRNVTIRDVTDIEYMNTLHQGAQKNLIKVKLLADLFIGDVLTCKVNKLQNALDSLSTIVDTVLANDYDANRQYRIEAFKKLNTDLPDGKPPRRPFHWALEFPEVFQDGGFDAVCGNPPFSGGQHLTGTLGTAYRNFMVNHIANGARGSADLVAYFYLNTYDLLKQGGVFGLIACNTIAEGDTRQVGLERLLKQGATIIVANPNMPWPGKAAVVISPVFIAKNIEWHGKYFLNDTEVETISAFLSAQEEWSPKVLEANAGQSFIGSYVLGMGFTMSEEEAKAFIAKDPKNAEVLFPYLNGDDLNSDPEQKPSRWVINFFDWPLDRDADGSWETADERKKKAFLSSGHVPADYPSRVAADFPELLDIVREKVKPDRDELNDSNSTGRRRKLFWWLYGGDSKGLYHAIGQGSFFVKHPQCWSKEQSAKQVWGTALSSKHRSFFNYPNNIVIDQTNVSIVNDDIKKIFCLFSSMHIVWGLMQGATLGTSTSRYTPSDCYETFPFPSALPVALESLGYAYDDLRKDIMKRNQIGLTKLYNAFHNPENTDSKLEELRQLQKQIDEAVRNAYGWNDIDLEHGFHAVSYLPDNDNIRYTVSEPARIEILRRLAQLNRQRWQEEQEAKR